MAGIDPTRYPPALAELLLMPLAPLGPGEPVHSIKAKLEALDDAVFGERLDRDMVSACRAGLWLAFNFLDESHEISQSLETVEGSYWHALMHRREPDYWNSKYWHDSAVGRVRRDACPSLPSTWNVHHDWQFPRGCGIPDGL